MSFRIPARTFIVTLLLFCAIARANCPPASSPLWQGAENFQALQLWAQAAQVYSQILAEWPDCQRAAVMLPACLLQTGQVQQALDALPGAIAMNPTSFWAEPGLYYLAAAQHTSGNNAAALQSIATLSQSFPESVSTVRAQIIAAQINGNALAIQAAMTAYEQELLAATQFQAALQADNGTDGAQALVLLNTVIAQYPNSGASLRALEAKGHLHVRNHQLEQAIAAFQEILNRISQGAPQSRIVAYARLEGAGAFFETLMLPPEQLALLEPAQWEQARALCQQVVAMEQAPPLAIARARLMIVETYHWQKCWADTLEAAQQFIATYDPVDFRREVATAHMLAGEALYMRRQPGPALTHFQWIMNEYSPDEEIWPRLHNLARTYYWTFDMLYQARAPLAQLMPAGNQILELFPGTRYAELVQNALDYIDEHGWPNP